MLFRSVYVCLPPVSLFLQSLKLRIPCFHLATSKRYSERKNKIKINRQSIYGSFNGTSNNANDYLLEFKVEYLKMSKFTKTGRCPTRCPYAIHCFVNFDVSKSLYLSEN